ncbi:MAG: hypothetical protein KF715_17535 [Candidatus Didemnitutus sp.]|nr:hypothetical protein [Candidatus Didemnitutus sp.]
MNASGATPHSATAALTLTRAELYARVWATPMLRLAAEFGVSDVAIAKLCRRRNIPRPAPGYWAKLGAGHLVEQPALPPATPQHDRPIVFRRATAPSVCEATAVAPSVLHPVAERVRRCLSRYKARAHGLVLVSEPGLPRVLASPAQAARIATFLHALLEGAAARHIAFNTDDERAPLFQRSERSARIRIEEMLQRGSPDGRLVVILRGPGGARRDVTRWEESGALSLARIERLALETLHAKLVPRPAAPAVIFPGRIRIERPAPRRLLREARRWESSVLLARYIAACEARWTRDEPGMTPTRDAWLAWAKNTANALSPFDNHPADAALSDEVVMSPSELFVAPASPLRRHSG